MTPSLRRPHHAFVLVAAVALSLACLAPTADAGPVASGNGFTVVAMPDQTVAAWGKNTNGQLGQGNTQGKAVPTAVPGLTDAVAVATGDSHTLVLTSGGLVYAFGLNSNRQLGDNTTTQRTSPVLLGLTGIVAIAAGDYHSVALANDGNIWTWGSNSYGELGHGTTSSNVGTPTLVTALSGVTAIAAGGRHTMVRKSDGTVWTFGYNGQGELGIGNQTNQSSPVQISGITTATALAAGANHSLVLLADGSVLSMGYNQFGQLGDASTTRRTSPVTVTGLTSVVAIAAGANHSGAIRTDGTLRLWGLGTNGQIGDGLTTNRLTATALAAPTSVGVLALGATHSVAVTSTGVVYTWGGNTTSQLGDGTTQLRATPDAISGQNYTWKVGTPTFNTAAGTYTTTKTVTVSVATPGATIHYTLDGNEPTESDPTVASGGTVLIDETRTLKARAWYGAMPPSNVAVALYTLQVATVTFSPSGGTYTTPRNVSLQTTSPGATIRYTLDGSTPTEASPVYGGPLAIGTTTTVRTIGFRSGWSTSSLASATYTMNFGTLTAPTPSPAAGSYTSGVAVTLSAMPGATIRYTIGTNPSNPNAGSPIYTGPIDVSVTATIKAIALHPDYATSPVTTGAYTIVVATPVVTPTAGAYPPGQVITVSSETAGATIRYTTSGLEPTESDPIIASGDTLPIGNFVLKARAYKTGATASGTTSVAYSVTGVGMAPRLAAGDAHTLAVRSDGTAFAWGLNSSGGLGDGTTTRRLSPILIDGLTGVTAMAAGDDFSLALRSDGRVFGWGYNGSGALGDGTTTAKSRPTHIVAATGAVALAAGTSHALALHADGTVRAWGGNSGGQVGDGTTTQRNAPVAVPGLAGIAAVEAGGTHSLAVTQAGLVYAWGSNGNGQLGDGTSTGRSSPGLVSALTGVTAVDGGTAFSVALKGDGTVVAWGHNSSGQLGDGSTTQRLVPVATLNLSNATAVAAGSSHALALLADGTVMAWGAGAQGQIGDGGLVNRLTPVLVGGLAAITQIAAGTSYSLAMDADGRVWAWGLNSNGQLGDGTTTNRATPTQIAGPGLVWRPPVPVLSDAAGLYYAERSVVVTHGDPSVVMRFSTTGIDPTELDPTITSGGAVSVTETLTLKVLAWKPGAPPSAAAVAAYELKAVAPTMTPGGGSYASSQSVALSSSTTGTVLRYTLDGTDVTAASPSYTAPLAIEVPLWLRARAYRPGWTPSDLTSATYWVSGGVTATPVLSPSPGSFEDDVLVTATSPAVDSVVRYTLDGTDPVDNSPVLRFPIVLRATTTVRVRAFKYGHAPSPIVTGTYDLDAPGAVPTPVVTPGGGWSTTAQTVTVTGPAGATLRYSTTGADPTEVDAIVTSGGTIAVPHSLTLKVRAFEAGSDASAVRRADFVITGALAAGDSHSMALRTDGTVWTWGDNSAGQIGDTLSADRLTPVQVLSDAVAISARGTRSLALKADGTVWAWGNNVGTPTQVASLSSVKAIAQGTTHALALKTDGTVWAWGTNTYGQLGDGSTTTRTTPVQVISLTGATAIAAGFDHSLALSSSGGSNGRVWAWGRNHQGQLGDALSATSRSTPTLVAGFDNARTIAAGTGWNAALRWDGALWAWGYNAMGELGNGTTASTALPTQSAAVVRGGMVLSGGAAHVLALDSAARLWMWGNASDGRLASTGSGATPFPQMSPLPETVIMAGGNRHTLVSTTSGAVFAFGYNTDGQLGNGSTTASTNPVQVVGLTLGDQSWLAADPDHDGLHTWREYLSNLDPLSADSNRDGLPDFLEAPAGGDPQDPDIDHDGIANWREPGLGTDPFNPDSDGDGHLDGADAYPTDPSRWQLPAPTPGDVTPPVITLTEPRNARPLP